MNNLYEKEALSNARLLELLLHTMELPAQRLVQFARTTNTTEYDLDLEAWFKNGKLLCKHYIEIAHLRMQRRTRGNFPY